MKFTGERIIPDEGDADLFNEHRARYLFARRFSAGKKVLDAACGSGYGSALLAENAQCVLAVDIDRETLAYARLHYPSPNLRFAQSDCLALPCPAGQFGLIAAFEIIEHLRDPGAFLRELRRVLQPAGLLLLSTPNRLYYTQDRGEVNPFHVREFSFPEFQELLNGVFPHCSIVFENHVPSMVISGSEPIGASISSLSTAIVFEEQEPLAFKENQERGAHYMIAICSAQPLPPVPPLLYLPTTANVLREREKHIRLLQQDRDLARARVQELDTQLEERTQWALKLQADNEERTRWALDLQQQLNEARAALQKLQAEFEERTAWALQLDAELNARREDLRLLYGSRWYRIGKNLRMSPVPPSDQPAPPGKGQ